MKVFVIGGNGFIGSHTVRKLLANNHRVRCMLRKTSKTQRIDGLDVERVVGDITDKASVAAGLEGCAAVIHLASPSAWRDINSPKLEATVKAGTQNVLEAARAQGDKKVVFVSTAIAVNAATRPTVFDESTPFTITQKSLRYAQSKHAAEALCLEFCRQGLPVMIVNPGEVYGPGDTELITAGNLVDFAKSSPVLVCNGGTAVAHVEDVAAGIVAALERGKAGERYILGGENLTVKELAAMTLEILGKKASIITVPNGVLKAVTAVATTLRIPLPFEPATIPYATRYWFMSNKKAREELGVSFRSARDTLAPTLAWLKSTGRVASA